MDMGGRPWDTEDWGSTYEYLDAVYKGKGKGKGKYGKPDGMYGKGGVKGGWGKPWNAGKGIGGKAGGKDGKGKGEGDTKGRGKGSIKGGATIVASQDTSRENASIRTPTMERVRIAETMDIQQSTASTHPECRTWRRNRHRREQVTHQQAGICTTWK